MRMFSDSLAADNRNWLVVGILLLQETVDNLQPELVVPAVVADNLHRFVVAAVVRNFPVVAELAVVGCSLNSLAAAVGNQ